LPTGWRKACAEEEKEETPSGKVLSSAAQKSFNPAPPHLRRVRYTTRHIRLTKEASA
jgi:hypothetical protein